VKLHDALFIQIDAFANNIFRLEANRWRPLRAKLSPTFSSGKMKNMFYLLQQKADQFGQYLDHLVPEEKVLDCNHIMSKFTADVIGSCIFGIELNAITEDNCEFLKMGRRLMQPRLKVHIKELVRNWPWLFDLIGNFLVDHDITDYFMQTVMKTIDYRLKNNIIRHDFMDILTDLKRNPEQLPEMGKPRDRRFSTYARFGVQSLMVACFSSCRNDRENNRVTGGRFLYRGLLHVIDCDDAHAVRAGLKSAHAGEGQIGDYGGVQKGERRVRI